ncbi:hypothetical protein ACIA8R_32065 [Nonomuraea sp. NPDC051191]|uniref:hypothetical protein n=1 Tax=Nonomuraea sp. NPDC051191 TaxID=3364372 RepID=UPI00378CB135
MQLSIPRRLGRRSRSVLVAAVAVAALVVAAGCAFGLALTGGGEAYGWGRG